MLGRAAVVTFPECDEAKDLLGLLTFADIGIRVAEHMAVGILGQEGEDAGLAAAAFGQVVGLNDRILAKIRHGMEVEIERRTSQHGLPGQLTMPQRQQPGDLLRGDARGIFRQIALLGHGVEPAEQRQTVIGHQRHDVALALDRPQLEGQRRAQGMADGIMLEPGSLAPSASASKSRRTRSWMNKNKPPTRVVNSRGESTKSWTLATACALGPTSVGRSSSSRRGNGAKPSSARTSRTAVALSGMPWSLRAWLIS